MQKNTFSVSGITCDSCVRAIEAKFNGSEGPGSTRVFRQPDRLEIETSNQLDASEINRLFDQFALTKYHAKDFVERKELVEEETQSLFVSLFPLALVISYLLGTVLLVGFVSSDFTFSSLMANYMAGFFLIFSFFKFLNLNGFVDAFQTYDPVARKWRPYGYFYAIFELMAGVFYLVSPQSIFLNSMVLIILSLSSFGVWKAVRSKTKIQCACLGTIFNLPMTKVTIVENVSMISMAAFMVLTQVF